MMKWLRATLRGDPCQLQLDFEGPPQNAEQLLARLRALGLKGITRCRLTRNRAVMVSFSGRELRIHEAYLGATPEVLEAIVAFVCGRTRHERRAAQRIILSFPIRAPLRTPVRRPGRTNEEDEALVRELMYWHAEYNARYFNGMLSTVPIRISRRMRSRLGQYTAASPYGEPAEIAISRAHIRRHGWAEALHTLLHEMVHQWQAESGYEIDHGAAFRAKAIEVGIAPHARRELRAAKAGRVVSPHELLLRAARQE
ncbi:MAG: SprT-like domain-containing protein [Gemmatimonadaceae bacterium]|nr:SprT-like domain-containing protein [Gemmatimonadaceae bacterium]